jgi:hypothetical protein
MAAPETNLDAQTLALLALSWCLQDERRADRLLGVTGLTTKDLRARAGEPALLAAVLGFLEADEPDLVACAEALALRPERLIAARRELEA